MISIYPEKVNTLKDWLANRKGIAVWGSINLSNPGVRWYTPAVTEAGEPYPKPTWQAGNSPVEIVTDANKVMVTIPKEVRRFKIHTRISGNGLAVKLTDASSQKVRRWVQEYSEKYNCVSWYQFDYETQEAVILIPEKEIPLSEYKE